MLGSPLVEAPLNEFGVRLVLGEDDRLADPVPTGHGVSLAHQGRQHLVHQPTTADSARLDPRAQALGYFASVARVQYYFDGKRRTARLMMAGHRIASGYEAVSIPMRDAWSSTEPWIISSSAKMQPN